MDFGLLGPVVVRDDAGRPVAIGGPLPRALLAVLLLAEGRVVPTETLLDQLWDGEPAEGAQATLHSTVSRLRKVLEPGERSRSGWQVLRSEGGGYRLTVPRASVDALRFAGLADAGRRSLDNGDAATATEQLREAESLWRGPALVEFADREFARAAAAGLDERRLSVAEDRLDADLRLSRHTAVLGELGRLAGMHPLRERLQQLLALALYRSGRQADALAALERTRTLLREELGLDPGAPLRELEAAILRQDAVLDLAPAAPAAVSAAPDVAAQQAPATVTIPRPRSPLIGRDVENGRLRALLHEVVAGATRFALIEGEPGIGKTRMLEEASAQATALGARVVWGRCSEADRAPAFWPWLEVLRGLGVTEDGRSIELSDLVGTDEGPDPAARRFALFESVADFLRTAAVQAPLVVLFEDLHWSDLPSAELLLHLADRLHDVPVAVLASLRELELGRDDAVAAALAAINRRSGTQRVHLRGLSSAAAPALVREVVDVDVRPEVALALHRRTDGNPFGLTELSRLLATEAALDDPDAVERAEVPAGVRDVVRRRLAALPQATRTLLETMAVLGREADLPVLMHASDLGVDACLDALEAALTSRVLTPVAEVPGRYRFAHALTREAALAEMNALRATRLHARVADAVAAVVGDTDETAEIVANHLWAASALVGPQRAAEALERAADVALRRLAYENAEDLLERAIAMRGTAPSGPAGEEAELESILALARLRRGLRGFSRARETVPLDRARDLAQRSGRNDLYVVLMNIEWGAAGTSGNLARNVELGRQMRDAATTTSDPMVRFFGTYMWGIACWNVGRLFEAAAVMDTFDEDLSRLSEADLATLRAADALTLFRCFAVHIRDLAGTLDDADERFETLYACVVEPNDRLMVANFGGLSGVCVGDPVRARSWGDRGMRGDESRTFDFFGAACEMYSGWGRALTGEPEAGLALIESGLERFVSTDSRTGLAIMLSLQAEAGLLAGRPVAEVARVLAGSEHLVHPDEMWSYPYLELTRARLALAAHEADERVLHHLRTAADFSDQTGVRPVRRLAEQMATLNGLSL